MGRSDFSDLPNMAGFCNRCGEPSASGRCNCAPPPAEPVADGEELQDLRRWKAEQLQVESEWDAQEVGKELGLQWGASIRANILPAIRSFKAQIAALKEKRNFDLDQANDALITAREALGKDDGPFLDDAIRRVIQERDQAKAQVTALVAQLESDLAEAKEMAKWNFNLWVDSRYTYYFCPINPPKEQP